MMLVPKNRNLLFVTDLDGTLLDHNTYSYSPANEALQRMREFNIPLILASSKTAAEVRPLRQELKFEHCGAIVENGAGLLSRNEEDIGSDETYQRLLSTISGAPLSLRSYFQGFSNLSLDELARITGLEKKQARLAKQRQYSEPGVWSGSDVELNQFLTYLDSVGVIAQEGGRFTTLSFGANKAEQMRRLVQQYAIGTELPFCVALGDAPNDIEMLSSADLGIVIPNPEHDGIQIPEAEAEGKIVHARFSGPRGWNAAVLDVLKNAEKI